MGRIVHPPPLARRRIAAPAVQALTPTEARDHLKLGAEWPESLLVGYLAAATEAAEREAEIALVNQQWAVAVDGWWCDDLALPFPPLVSVDEIKYRDAPQPAALKVLDPAIYESSTWHRPGRVRLAYGKSWPTVLPWLEVIEITFTCGHGTTPDKVPEGIRQAVRMLLAHNERNAAAIVRGETPVEIPLGVRWLLDKYRIPEAA